MSKTCLGGNPSPLLGSLQHSRHAWPPSALRDRLWKTHCLSLLPKAGGVNILPALGCISIKSRDTMERPCSQPPDLSSQPGLILSGCLHFLAFSLDLTFFPSVCSIDQASVSTSRVFAAWQYFTGVGIL